MKRVCFLLQVRPERLDEYVERHEHVWPEMVGALRDAGWRNYTLFHRDDGLIVGYLETASFEDALARMEDADVNTRWQREMAPFFALPAGARPDTAMRPLQEYFHID